MYDDEPPEYDLGPVRKPRVGDVFISAPGDPYTYFVIAQRGDGLLVLYRALGGPSTWGVLREWRPAPYPIVKGVKS